ncbi:MAG: taurine catabolism dioxygenase TauD [Betaproteobacteria bacterium]|nr:MAG: taurine catabolism dioxygenase TauD [Betaproteobacteria bacterium]
MDAQTGAAFDLADDAAYQAWRAAKLARFPKSLAELTVEVRDPRALSAGERQALIEHCERANMAVYASRAGGDPDKEIPRRLGLQLGLSDLDPNYLADDDGISPLAVAPHGARGEFIPYTNRGINWHTDGYYGERTVRAVLLHCVARAETGGENDLLDHEIAYILLRDRNPQHIRALMAHDAMTIPARIEGGRVERPARAGPVFSVDPGGILHLRYTARALSIEWKNDAATHAARAALEDILGAPSPWVFRGRLEPGMGLLSNNILHTRTPFTDSPLRRRLIYRARYYQRVGAD